MKSHSGSKKRLHVTGRGKVKVPKTSKQHLLIHKSKRQKNAGQASNGVILTKILVHKAKNLLPYSKIV